MPVAAANLTNKRKFRILKGRPFNCLDWNLTGTVALDFYKILQKTKRRDLKDQARRLGLQQLG